jgi:hypothetical protein
VVRDLADELAEHARVLADLPIDAGEHALQPQGHLLDEGPLGVVEAFIRHADSVPRTRARKSAST